MYSLLSILAATAAATQPLGISNKHIDMQFAPRTPHQIMSFYEARGFPPEMIKILSRKCFITVRIHNKSKDIVWHDLTNWHFSHNGKPLKREHRNYWLDKWNAMNMPKASISTFRWTLLPESLDYLPDEEEGGNIILPRVTGPITLNATFPTADKQLGSVISVEYDELYCAEDNAES
jgi:hypothetical protein